MQVLLPSAMEVAENIHVESYLVQSMERPGNESRRESRAPHATRCSDYTGRHWDGAEMLPFNKNGGVKEGKPLRGGSSHRLAMSLWLVSTRLYGSILFE